MALSGGELAAVISGSVAGLIFLLAVIAIVLYFCVRKRRRRRHPDKKPFPHHHLTPDTSLSKNSLPKQGDLRDPRAPPRLDPRLDPRVDPRLPKIGSTNLWFGTPSMYSAAPSQVYADMKRKGPTRPPEQPRAFPGPPGHVMYQGVGAGRIYHSQQVAPSLYDSEYRIQRSGSYMDLYSYPYNYDPYRDMNNSSAVLVEYPDKEEYYLDRYREREVRRTGKKVKRSQSDVTLHSTRRPKNRKQRGETPFDRPVQSSTKSRDDDDKTSNERRGSRNSIDKYDKGSHDNRDSRTKDRDAGRNEPRTTVVDVHRPKKPAPAPPQSKPKRSEDRTTHVVEVESKLTESATDSAKLRAIEWERAKEKERALERELDKVIERDNHAFVHDEVTSSEFNVRHYTYEGKPSKYENSVVAKMAALTETPKATYIRPNAPSDQPTREIPHSFHAEVSKKLEDLKNSDSVDVMRALDTADGPVATSTGKHSRASRPTSGREHRRSRRGSTVTDADGNIVEAFGFLDGYSDGEGTDYHDSGQSTPTPARDNDINL